MTDARDDLEDQLDDIALLDEPTRRALYRYVVGRPDAVGRDEAAAAVDVSRGLAAFHLDRLAEAGLLEVEYRRLSGRSGPGAGRPAKLYRRAERQVDVTLPPRRFRLAAELLADALDRPEAGPARGALADAARERGRAEAARLAAGLGSRPSRARRLEALWAVLSDCGYEPYQDGGAWRVRNCPFHPLASAHTELVCGMTGEFVAGAAGALALAPELALDPRPGECCVVIRF
ncbi:MAG TPA: helix-turn-helix domain-containing protein [Egibacteraceae bacterium]|nr:helix-turn-helix domain-containing protein [Egibacteraceae bacterium]